MMPLEAFSTVDIDFHEIHMRIRTLKIQFCAFEGILAFEHKKLISLRSR